MDEFLNRFDYLDHYELLGVSRDVDPVTLQHAWSVRARRYDPTYAPPMERAAFERASRAIEGAYAVLSDPAKRQRYDLTRAGARGASADPLSDFTWNASAPSPAPAPPPSRISSSELRGATSDPRHDAINATLGKVLAEVERVATAVHLLVAQSVEPGAVKVETLVAAATSLAETRATLAALQAEREEEAGRLAQAATLWQRVARQRPTDPAAWMRASDALRKGAGDLDGAEAMANRALAIDPDHAEAHAAVAVIQTLRARRAGAPR
ncbi:MAG: DnaJ domain-containing protein [Polyangiales bacterium]